MREKELLKIKDKKYDRKEISVHLFGSRNLWCKVINRVKFYNNKGCKYFNISGNNHKDDWDDEDNSTILVKMVPLFGIV